MDDLTRRDAVRLLAAAGATATVSADCVRAAREPKDHAMRHDDLSADPASPLSGAKGSSVAEEPLVLATKELPFVWPTLDPFLFCVHHDDRYPRGDGRFGPAASLAGRDLGQDFAGKDGWRMYHGRKVPGFPQHPHRGFETVTVVRHGLLDHSDSLGAAARYGHGDVQWLTAGRGILHAEMFPLLEEARDNPVELFQIWLNLPATDKMAEPHFAMFWAETIPKKVVRDAQGRATTITVIAGRYDDLVPLAPPPRSYASRPESDLAIWTLALEPGARFELPAAKPGTRRSLYVFAGNGLRVGDTKVPGRRGLELRGDRPAVLENGETVAELLLLQARPIAEPVAQHGPFVMNTREEIQQAYADYRATQFGGWPWPSDDPVHGRESRFARRVDGSTERPA